MKIQPSILPHLARQQSSLSDSRLCSSKAVENGEAQSLSRLTLLTPSKTPQWISPFRSQGIITPLRGERFSLHRQYSRYGELKAMIADSQEARVYPKHPFPKLQMLKPLCS